MIAAHLSAIVLSMETAQHVVKRANETIGIVPAGKQRITLLVRRLYSVILLFSQQQGEKEEYSALLSDMLETANSIGSNRTQVKEILREIRSIGVDWNVRDGDRDIWKNVGLIEEPGLIDGKGVPTIVTWKLPKIIRNRLLDPRGFFTKISLEMMTRLRSGASIALYEICCQYVTNDHGKGEGGLTNRASVDEWMPRLTGSRKANYEYKFLKRDVLQPAIDELNEITDLRVELVEHKAGRKVDELQFRVFHKLNSENDNSSKRLSIKSSAATTVEKAAYPFFERVVAIGASTKVAERICKKYSDDQPYLLRHIEYVEARIRNPKAAQIYSKAAFLQKALDQGYADTMPAATTQIVLALPVTKERASEVRTKDEGTLAREEIWKQYQQITDEVVKATLIQEFLGQSNSTVQTFYKKNGINNMLVKVHFTEWLIKSRSPMFFSTTKERRAL